MGKRGEDDDRTLAQYLKYSHLGIQFLLAVGLPTALGIWLDRRWGTKVLFTLLGLALGFTGGFYSIYGELFGRRGGDKDRGRRGPPSGPPGDGPPGEP
jgi:F0F1-type ATP synthase assembly protein I